MEIKNGCKILIVDDDEDFRSEIRDFLEEYDVIEASNGDKALGLLKRPNDIDLVILDVKMPGLSGTTILKKIKDMLPDIGVIILTGYGSKDIAIEALRGKSDDYIEKPVDIENIKVIIERVLESKRGDEDIDSIDVNGKIERVKRFVERNCYKRLCLKDAAESVYMSPKYLSRIFKQNTGISFSRYRLNIKISKAKELLGATGYNINQIAYNLGFQNAESFMRIFKKLTNCTPTEYRVKKKKQKKKK
jgi:two-component system response regulator YesN